MIRATALAAAMCALAACSGGGTNDGGLDAMRDGSSPVDAGADGTDAPVDAPLDSGNDAGPTFVSPARHSSSIAVSPDGLHVYVVNADEDSVSIVDPVGHALEAEILLGTSRPAVDPTTGRYDTAIGPRALALAPHANVLYVSGQRSGDVRVVDLSSRAVVATIPVGSEPLGVLVSPDERSVYVACSQDAMVVRIDATSRQVVGRANTALKPWALGWSLDGSTLYATHLLYAASSGTTLTAGVSAIDPAAMTVRTVLPVPDAAPRSPLTLANGQPRGLYDVVAQPGSGNLWIPHLLLATQTSETPANAPPATNPLAFNTTVFQTVTVLGSTGALVQRLTPSDTNTGDVSSGPHAIEFSADGHYAFVLDTNSEDVMEIDTRTGTVEAFEAFTGHMQEGIALAPDGVHLYVDERNTHDVAVLTFDPTRETPVLADGTPIERLGTPDSMPVDMRTGQRWFHAAESGPLQPPAITHNSWVACASCHVEARSDAVTWRFSAGPRDTPSNAGGMLNTGFLLRTADRRSVMDYSHTIVTEQGGDPGFVTSTNAAYQSVLMALTDYVNHAIPLPVPPTMSDPSGPAHGQPVGAASVARGQALFGTGQCASCHTGAWFTDSGAGNPGLDLSGVVLLHDVGTCVTSGVFPDVPHTAVDGSSRGACSFDTPTLRGVSESAPYLHDGSAVTLHDVFTLTRGHMGNTASFTDANIDDLVAYLRTL